MEEYLMPAGFGEVEFIEKRSRFIGRVWPTETEEEAVSHIQSMRTQHWDANHNVYAYAIREGNLLRFSDDGEPQGTSGLPTLNVFSREGVWNVTCVVTRYFGGVLLGAGGLSRAYSHTAKLALEAAGVCSMGIFTKLVLSVGYPLFERVKKEIPSHGGFVKNIDYGAEIYITALVPSDMVTAFSSRLDEISGGGIKVELIGENVRHHKHPI